MLVTMHATLMVFFVIMPLLIGVFGNFLIPLHIGAPDMAFPFFNELSFWLFFASGVIMMYSFFVPGGAAAGGWTTLRPAEFRSARTTPRRRAEPVGHRHLRQRPGVHRGRVQLHHDRHQHARARA